MTVTFPLVLVLGIVAWVAIKFLGIRMWAAIVIALFGFWLAHTFLAPAVESGTRTGVHLVNGKHI
ncbi:hypothetical protein [Streptomyces sp. NPDC002067]